MIVGTLATGDYSGIDVTCTFYSVEASTDYASSDVSYADLCYDDYWDTTVYSDWYVSYIHSFILK